MVTPRVTVGEAKRGREGEKKGGWGGGGGSKESRIKLHCICSEMVCKCVLVMANQMV